MNIIQLIHESEVDAPADLVWGVVTDYRRDPEWRDGVLSMTASPAGPVAVGTTTAEELRVAGKVWHNDGEVTAVEPGRRFEWRTTVGAVADGARSVEAIDERRCRVRLELNVTPTGMNRLLAPVFRRLLDRGLAGDVERLRRLVEQSAMAPT